MTRLHKKCLIASTGTHAFLALLLVFGAAFFVAQGRPIPHSKLHLVPPGDIEITLAGGGKPNPSRADDVQESQLPPPLLTTPPQQIAQPRPAASPSPAARPEPKKVDPAKSEQVTKAAEESNPTEKPAVRRKISRADLKLIGPSEAEKAKTKTETEAREAARKANLEARKKLDEQLAGVLKDIQRGIQADSIVNVGGAGGPAFADYGASVQAAYADAWKIIQDLSDDDSIAVVRVVVARDGRVLSSQFINRSGNPAMDRSVQRALDKVRDEHLPPFPDFINDPERNFTIEFNLKTRRLLG